MLGGSGGTGTTGIQLAKAFGAGVVTTTTSADNFPYCKSIGADVLIDYKTVCALSSAVRSEMKHSHFEMQRWFLLTSPLFLIEKCIIVSASSSLLVLVHPVPTTTHDQLCSKIY